MSTDEKVFTTLYLSVSCICENFCPKTLLKLHFQCSGEPEMPGDARLVEQTFKNA